MKKLIIILTIAAFLQTTVIPIDLILLILICRAYIKSEKSNLYLAFAFGLLVGHLNLAPFGIISLIYLTFVAVTQALSRLRLAGNPLLIVPVVFVYASLDQLMSSVFMHETMEFSRIIISASLSLPLLYLIRLWEERFIVQKEIKLNL